MKGDTEEMLERRARRAYEVGRANSALRHAIPLAVFTGVALVVGDRTPMTFAVAALLMALGLTMNMTSNALGAQVVRGVITGAVPYVAITIARQSAHACHGPSCTNVCLVACIASGIVAGGLTAARARKAPARLLEIGASMTVATLVAALACSHVGMVGVWAVGVALVLGFAPARWVLASA